MKKVLLIAFILVLLVGGVFMYIKATPPLLTGTIAKSEDKQTVVIGLGNKGFSDLEVTHVKVNNHADPNGIKMQVSNPLVGFTVTVDENADEAKKIEYKEVEEVKILEGTIPEEIWKKQDEGTATEDDIIYGLVVTHHEEIHNVHIKYRYLGIMFNETLILD